MSLALDDLPRDPDRLLLMLQQMAEVTAGERSRITSLEIERDTILAERDAVRTERDLIREKHDAAQAEIEKLRLLIRQLQRGQFGRRSEKLTPTSCSSAWRTSSRPSRQPRRPKRRWQQGTAPLGHLGFGDATWAACRRIYRGSRSWSTSRTRAALAVAVACT